MGYLDSLMGRNERLVFVTRQHWLEVVFVGLQDSLIFLVITILTFLLNRLTEQLFVFVLLLLLIFPVVHFAIRALNWHNEQYIVTNRRVMQIKGVINKHVSDSSLEKVNDVVLDQSILGRLMGYGNLEIITGSDIGANYFKRMAQPIRFKTNMLDQKEAVSKFEEKGAQQPTDRDQIIELINELDDLRKKGVITEQEFEAKKAQLLARI